MVLRANDFNRQYKPAYDRTILTCKGMKFKEKIYYKHGYKSLMNYFGNIDYFNW
jgi:hypothetical protein